MLFAVFLRRLERHPANGNARRHGNPSHSD